MLFRYVSLYLHFPEVEKNSFFLVIGNGANRDEIDPLKYQNIVYTLSNISLVSYDHFFSN